MEPILKSPEKLLFPTKPMLCGPTAFWQPIYWYILLKNIRNQGSVFHNKRNLVMDIIVGIKW